MTEVLRVSDVVGAGGRYQEREVPGRVGFHGGRQRTGLAVDHDNAIRQRQAVLRVGDATRDPTVALQRKVDAGMVSPSATVIGVPLVTVQPSSHGRLL